MIVSAGSSSAVSIKTDPLSHGVPSGQSRPVETIAAISQVK
ncbi:hypothetical protein RMSM_00584 [Rhodopirellula maiorica SM1]|uniref:Uncharacterized protein n=1 Tax=Rhodopirellula maiorica SM1 TaxID=1265738 RepID=M5RT67_9BACT|nr:hypothetical protein RMSM_00584 [Rhodopirellula maiorica SM1]